MNETVLTLEEAARCLPALVQQVHATGEAALLVQSGQPLARIVAVPANQPGSDDLIAFLRQWRLDYPEPDDQFAEVIEQSRQAIRPPHDPIADILDAVWFDTQA
jgi:antitoxin (DNA-binding transcriptional repressor) of toxin-antitoxin stability system